MDYVIPNNILSQINKCQEEMERKHKTTNAWQNKHDAINSLFNKINFLLPDDDKMPNIDKFEINSLSQFKEWMTDMMSHLEDLTLDILKSIPFQEIYQLGIDWIEIVERSRNRIIGDVYLYPGFPMMIGPIGNESPCGRRWGNYGTMGDEQISIATRIMSRECNNWARYYHPQLGHRGIDEYLPTSLFIGKKEGDVITLPFRGYEVKLTIKQEKHTSGPYGFDVILTSLMSATSR